MIIKKKKIALQISIMLIALFVMFAAKNILGGFALLFVQTVALLAFLFVARPLSSVVRYYAQASADGYKSGSGDRVSFFEWSLFGVGISLVVVALAQMLMPNMFYILNVEPHILRRVSVLGLFVGILIMAIGKYIFRSGK